MSKFTTIILLLIFTTTLHGQQADPAPTLTKQHYLKKNKNQRTVAWILGGSGIVLLGTGLALAAADTGEDLASIFNPEANDGGDSGGVFVVVGLAALVTSVPLFVAADKNKRKAMSLSLRNVPSQQLIGYSIAYRPIPSLSLKINL